MGKKLIWYFPTLVTDPSKHLPADYQFPQEMVKVHWPVVFPRFPFISKPYYDECLNS